MIIGGAGFMGSNFVRYLIKEIGDVEVLVYDKLTYAGRLESLRDLINMKNLKFTRADLCDEENLTKTIEGFDPEIIVNFAAETHVDRSINEPAPFLKTNILGVFTLLEVVRRREVPLVIHISTDEVYGDLWNIQPANEKSPLIPSNPYSASKASGDLLAQAYWKTYRLPIIIVRPSNNYGPYQYPEKLIPKTIIRALHNMPVPVYGDGMQIRDWLYVKDFCEALNVIIERGKKGEVYNVPGLNERRNIEVVRDILKLLGKQLSLIKFVEDRPGHDKRYAMKGDKILALGWRPKTPWSEGLRMTVEWYMNNEWWWKPLLSDRYFQIDTPWGGERGASSRYWS